MKIRKVVNHRSQILDRMKRVYLSLGSNLGNAVVNIRRALRMLAAKGIRAHRVSSLYKTEPVDYKAQPWFVNCVAEVSTDLAPLQLLKTLQSVERALGRRRRIPRGPRLIDIDILVYDNTVVRSRGLTIPHERLAERRFVLVPLREIAPTLRHPKTRRAVSQMLRQTPDKSKVIRINRQHGIRNDEA